MQQTRLTKRRVDEPPVLCPKRLAMQPSTVVVQRNLVGCELPPVPPDAASVLAQLELLRADGGLAVLSDLGKQKRAMLRQQTAPVTCLICYAAVVA